eukprot:TRINITY_DN12042_c0_g1_i1.p1 TRINITY_DN12042_c0_g1~~TRINITY_DN12042_c0_g1_i1.p1  ORF type:complete len:190 (-),score=7.96 TRINITY_DN12042_c0_g1_i1:593-1141(-)
METNHLWVVRILQLGYPLPESAFNIETLSMLFAENLLTLPKNCISFRTFFAESHKVTSQLISTLPPYIHKADFSNRTFTSPRVLDQLPSRVHALYLNQCAQINYEYLQRLPSSIYDLHLDECLHLTRQDLKCIPNSMQKISLKKCTLLHVIACSDQDKAYKSGELSQIFPAQIRTISEPKAN